MIPDPTPAWNGQAWDELSSLEQRLLADALLYPIDLLSEIEKARSKIQQELADPVEPPEVAAALTMPLPTVEELGGPAEHLFPDGPPSAIEDPPELRIHPSPQLLDHLIRWSFDE